MFTQAHTNLRCEIARARDQVAHLYDTYLHASYETADEDFQAWRIANARHSALIEAGVIMALGTEEE
jgi:hypothetical protein